MTAIGIETNVLLRMGLNDDAEQQGKALKFGSGLTRNNPGYVNLMVLVEFNWSLAARYRQPKEQRLLAIQRLLNTGTLVFESFDAVVRALERARGPQVDFSDALIAEHNLEQGCSHTVTFDRDAAKALPSMELLA